MSQHNLIINCNEKTIFEKNLRGSKITSCKFNNFYICINKYKKIQMFLYSLTERNIIINNSVLNVIQEIKNDKGYKYYDKLGFSIQGADATMTLKEIINICKLKNFNIELEIKLENNENIKIVI